MTGIYMDHSATTPVAPEVLEAMLPYFSSKFGNPSSLHSFGMDGREAVEEARVKTSELIGANPEEIYFTSGGTESDNMAIKGAAHKNRKLGKHIITTTIEHPAVLEVCGSLEREGFSVTYVPVDDQGLIDPSAVEAAISTDTILISIMHANNEIGTIQPISEIGRIAEDHDVLFHTDAVQTAGKIPFDVKQDGVDLLSISGHKLYGPKGTGALYIRSGTRIDKLIHGGGHERGMRSGTENVPGIVGLGAACALAMMTMEAEAQRQTRIRDQLMKWVLSDIEESWLNGHPTKRLPSNLNFGFSRVEGESMMLFLDMMGIAVSTGSACSSKKLEPSHVLRAIGLPPERCHGSLRITLGRDNNMDHALLLREALIKAVLRFRAISAL